MDCDHPWPAGVHFAVWGRVDTAHDNATEMTLGLPADTLAVYGIKNLPKDYMLDIRVSGTTTNPKVDWSRCASIRNMNLVRS